jgi:hypothetical protein
VYEIESGKVKKLVDLVDKPVFLAIVEQE